MLPRQPLSTLFPYTTLFRSLGQNSVRSKRVRYLAPLSKFVVARCAWKSASRTSARTMPQDYPDTPRRRSRSVQTCPRSEEHTSELQSRENLVCRLLLEKKKK